MSITTFQVAQGLIHLRKQITTYYNKFKSRYCIDIILTYLKSPNNLLFQGDGYIKSISSHYKKHQSEENKNKKEIVKLDMGLEKKIIFALVLFAAKISFTSSTGQTPNFHNLVCSSNYCYHRHYQHYSNMVIIIIIITSQSYSLSILIHVLFMNYCGCG